MDVRRTGRDGRRDGDHVSLEAAVVGDLLGVVGDARLVDGLDAALELVLVQCVEAARRELLLVEADDLRAEKISTCEGQRESEDVPCRSG